jgi:serine/threonine protein kinase
VFNRFSPMDCERGALPLLWDIFEVLCTVEGVEKPLGYGEIKFTGQTNTEGAIVFNNIMQAGYVMGVPPDQDDYNSFLLALESLVHQIHACGVIHMDLYPSNILWAKVGGTIKVRIIDWDAASFRNQPLPEKMQDRLKSKMFYKDRQSMPTPKFDAWHVFILSGLDRSQRESLHGDAPGDAPHVVASYLECTRVRIDSRGSADALEQDFLIWYADFESRGRTAAEVEDQFLARGSCRGSLPGT